MTNLAKQKKRLLRNSAIVVALGILSVFLIIGATPGFKSQGYALLLVLLFFVQMPFILNVIFTALRVIGVLVNIEESKKTLVSLEDDEAMEKEVEEKVKEADDLAINLALLKENLADVTDWETFGQRLLIELSKQLKVSIGMFYGYSAEMEKYISYASYAYFSENPITEFESGEGLAGQVVKNKAPMFLTDIPNGYMKIVSGLGELEPKNLALLPLLKDNKVVGLIELGSFDHIGKGVERRGDEISRFIGELCPNA